LAEGAFQGIVESLAGTFTGLFRPSLGIQSPNADKLMISASLLLLKPALCGTGVRSQQIRDNQDVIIPLLPLLFVGGWLAPEREYIASQAQDIYLRWNSQAEEASKQTIQSIIIATLASYLSDVDISISYAMWFFSRDTILLNSSPEEILLLFLDSTRPAFLTTDIVTKDLLPTEPAMFGLLINLHPSPIDNSLSVLDPLIPPPVFAADTPKHSASSRATSPYDRLVRAFVHVFYHDRAKARSSLWVLRHLIVHQLYAQDWLSVRKDPGMFGSDTDAVHISDMLEKTKVLVAYMFHAALADAGDGWRSGLVEALTQNIQTPRSPLSDFLQGLIQSSIESDTIREARVANIVFSRLFEDMEKDEADKWMNYAKLIQKNGISALFAFRSQCLIERSNNSTSSL
jgi:hypothetical protein